MEIKVLGPGCSRCKATYRVVEKVVRELGLDVQLSKVEDVVEMMRYPILTTPAVVVDGEVRIKGHVPSEEEVKQLLGH
ncbi:thioredoxin family protein [Millionella massiliensis]|uniref:thioredoxin family protein n=1 Tax=Millionella massiliensis TaxID=1871023 RepID=UPI0008DB1838|nr:thioredoxin family protein [Millionella massiliensis]